MEIKVSTENIDSTTQRLYEKLNNKFKNKENNIAVRTAMNELCNYYNDVDYINNNFKSFMRELEFSDNICTINVRKRF